MRASWINPMTDFRGSAGRPIPVYLPTATDPHPLIARMTEGERLRRVGALMSPCVCKWPYEVGLGAMTVSAVEGMPLFVEFAAAEA
jgi:hypothetical protein